jgi:hypothetical protein
VNASGVKSSQDFQRASIALSYAPQLFIHPSASEAAGATLVNFDFHVENQFAIFCAHPNRFDQVKHSFLFGRLKKRSNIKDELLPI